MSPRPRYVILDAARGDSYLASFSIKSAASNGQLTLMSPRASLIANNRWKLQC